VRTTRGAILDIIVDLRPESPTYLEHIAVAPTADNHRALYVPERFARGFQVLEDNTETSYAIGEFYFPVSKADLPTMNPGWGLPCHWWR
jgi:dTDP-4-dehydrorhamnose 3,5-epimerase